MMTIVSVNDMDVATSSFTHMYYLSCEFWSVLSIFLFFFRIHILEEQLRDVELKSQKKIQEEEKRTREFMVGFLWARRWHINLYCVNFTSQIWSIDFDDIDYQVKNPSKTQPDVLYFDLLSTSEVFDSTKSFLWHAISKLGIKLLVYFDGWKIQYAKTFHLFFSLEQIKTRQRR